MAASTVTKKATDRIAHHLARNVGEGKYRLWFRSARLRAEEGGVEVTVPNRFVADWIDSHFHDQLLEAAEAEFGQGAAVQVRIDPEQRRAAQEAGPAEPVKGASGGAAASSSSSSEGSRANNRAARTGGTASAGVTSGANGAARPAVRSGRASKGEGASGAAMTLRHELDDFVVGPSNELAYTAARRLIDEPGAEMNPLFIHGGCGLGKTHLLQGLCRRYLQQNGGTRWCYTTAEQFTNRYIQAVRQNKLEEFRRRLRRLDLLAVDDVHFLANKSATQQEFLHTFDAIDLHGAKLVLASDAHPKLIRELADALVSRFMSGMVAGVTRPDFQTRRRIIEGLARRRGLELMDSAAEALAERCEGSVRELEGVVTKLTALASLRRSGSGAPGGRAPIGHALVGELFGAASASPARQRPVRLEQIIAVVCERLRVSRDELRSGKRHKRVVLARSAVIYLARRLTTLSYPELARGLGRPNHSTIVTASRRIEKQVQERQAVGLPVSAGEDEGLPRQMDQLVEHLRRRVVEAVDRGEAG